jgi:hypothetical protein
MRHAFLAAALAAAVPASAQVAGSSLDVTPEAARQAVDAAKALNAKMAPAAVDPRPVQALLERLAKDGDQLQTVDGNEDAYQRLGVPDQNGSRHNLEVGVVEEPDPAAQVDGSGQPQYQDLVIRRYFSSLQAQSEDWAVKKDGTGQVDLWHYTVSLDGQLLTVEHDVIPVKPGPDGQPQPQQNQAQIYQLPPSDKAVLARWNVLVKKLLTLGRTISA